MCVMCVMASFFYLHLTIPGMSYNRHDRLRSYFYAQKIVISLNSNNDKTLKNDLNMWLSGKGRPTKRTVLERL